MVFFFLEMVIVYQLTYEIISVNHKDCLFKCENNIVANLFELNIIYKLRGCILTG